MESAVLLLSVGAGEGERERLFRLFLLFLQHLEVIDPTSCLEHTHPHPHTHTYINRWVEKSPLSHKRPPVPPPSHARSSQLGRPCDPHTLPIALMPHSFILGTNLHAELREYPCLCAKTQCHSCEREMKAIEPSQE